MYLLEISNNSFRVQLQCFLLNLRTQTMTPRQIAQNKNHPGKGAIVTQQPITDKVALERMKGLFWDHPRNFALLIVGINTALRASDLLTLKVADVLGDIITIREQKTGKKREFYLNDAVKRAVAPLIAGRAADDWLFPSETTGQPICVPAFSGMVKLWCFRAGLKGMYASHSLRKTWCRAMVDAGEPLWKVSEALGHSSEKMTRKYIGIEVDSLKSMHMREV
jgi:integrase